MLHIHFFDMGQGDGILMQLPPLPKAVKGYKKGYTPHIMVDFGSMKNRNLVLKDALNFMAKNTRFGKKNAQLDLLVITHPDEDHYNLIQEFVTQLKPNIKNLLFSGRNNQYTAGFPKYWNLIRFLKKIYPKINILNINHTPCLFAANWMPPSVQMNILAMNIVGVNTNNNLDKNTNSIVLSLDYAGERVILCGDATVFTEKYMLKKLKKNFFKTKTSIHKVGHHGSSRTSISEDWIKAIQPFYNVVLSDRQGTSSQKSGHRLPQLCALDIIADSKINKNLAKTLPHTIVAYYDPNDYKIRNRPNPHKWKKASWVELNIKTGIFTTIYKMGNTQKAQDFGAHYHFTINQNGGINVSW